MFVYGKTYRLRDVEGFRRSYAANQRVINFLEGEEFTVTSLGGRNPDINYQNFGPDVSSIARSDGRTFNSVEIHGEEFHFFEEVNGQDSTQKVDGLEIIRNEPVIRIRELDITSAEQAAEVIATIQKAYNL